MGSPIFLLFSELFISSMEAIIKTKEDRLRVTYIDDKFAVVEKGKLQNVSQHQQCPP